MSVHLSVCLLVPLITFLSKSPFIQLETTVRNTPKLIAGSAINIINHKATLTSLLRQLVCCDEDPLVVDRRGDGVSGRTGTGSMSQPEFFITMELLVGC